MVTDVRSRLNISDEGLAAFCRKWKIVRLELFGSALRDDFDPEKSDIDLLYVTEPRAWSLFDHVHAEDELSTLLDRKVDLASRQAIESSSNWIRKNRILGEARVIYSE